MIDDKPSQTAIMALVSRAIDAELPLEQRIGNDELAQYFLTSRSTLIGETWIPKRLVRIYHQLFFPGVSGLVVVRSRYFDDTMLQAVRNGATQIVDLGAGYDTRFYRFRNELRALRLFEVDFPATQQRKTALLEKVPGGPFTNVRYVPVDFMKDSLSQRLLDAGMDPTAKTLFLWEGVSYYVDESAVKATLRFIRENSAPGSGIVFDTLPPVVVEYTRRHKNVHNTVEPLQWGIDVEKIPGFLKENGFDCVENGPASEWGKKYCIGNIKRRTVSKWYSFTYAVVGK